MQQLKNLSYGNAKMGLDEFALREVATLVNLECLNCYINETSWEHLTHLQRLKKLHSIELRANMYISGENLKALSYHPSLEKVYLTYMKDTEVVDVLITMPNLKMLMTADKADSEVVKYAKSRLNGVEIITH